MAVSFGVKPSWPIGRVKGKEENTLVVIPTCMALDIASATSRGIKSCAPHLTGKIEIEIEFEIEF